MVSLEFYIDVIIPSVLGSNQPLTETSTRNISWGVQAAGAYGGQPYHIHVPIVTKCGSLNLVELTEPLQACTGITYLYIYPDYLKTEGSLLHNTSLNVQTLVYSKYFVLIRQFRFHCITSHEPLNFVGATMSK
jgi:hypothetical protein